MLGSQMPSEPKRILVRSVNWLGDAVMTTPALMRLRERFPEAEIRIMTPEKLADLWRYHPAVDSALVFSEQESVWKIGRQLRARQFDLALVLPNSPRSALEMWLGRIPERVGYVAKWRRWWLTRAVPPWPGAVAMRKRSAGEIRRLNRRDLRRDLRLSPTAHHTNHYLHLVAALGANPAPVAPQLNVTDLELDRTRQKFNLDPQVRWIGLNAGAEYGPAKRWPADHFIATALALQQRLKVGWIIFGGGADAAIARQIEAALRRGDATVRNLAGQTTLRELCAALQTCRVVLTNDTGPMHVAAAVGTPVIVPFGSTSLELTGPGLPGDPQHRLLRGEAPCSPCFRRECPIDLRCLTSITVERVVEELYDVAVGA
jgi:heptosyltransferase-2